MFVETGEKTRWVRFVDEVNEKISQVQETCLAIYNGFYCISEVLNSILYCCEHLNRKFYSNLTSNAGNAYLGYFKSSSSSLSPSNADSTDPTPQPNKILNKMSSLERMQADYTKNVIDKFDGVRKIINSLLPLNYRLEVLENIYALIYLTSNDLKEVDEDESDDENDLEQNYDAAGVANQKNDLDEAEFSIYNNTINFKAANLNDTGNLSSKSTVGSYCSRGSLNMRNSFNAGNFNDQMFINCFISKLIDFHNLLFYSKMF